MLEPDEQNLALSQGLLGLGAGLLSGSFGHYGAFAPALGSGLSGFQAGYGNALNQSLHMKMFNQQKMLQDAQISNYKSEEAKRNFEMEQQRQALANASGADQYANQRFAIPPMAPVPQPMVPKKINSVMGQPVVAANAPSVFNDESIQPTPIDVNQMAPAEVVAPRKSNLMNPDWHLARAEYLLSKGDRKGADEALNQSMKLRNEERTLGKDELDKPLEGVPGITFNAKTGQYKEDGKPVTAARVQQIKTDLANAGSTKLTNNINAQLPASEAAQKDFIDKASKNYDSLRNAPAMINNFQQIRELVPKAGSFVGSFADKKVAIAQFFNNNFGTTIDPQAVASANELKTRLFYQIMENLKKMDAQPSELQQKMMMDALGNITVDPKAIPRIVDVAEQALRTKVDLHNKEVQSAIDRGVKFPFDPIIKLPDTPKMGPRGNLSETERQELEALRKRFNKK